MNSTTFYAFLGGAAIGAGIGFLMAPRSGLETRQRIRQGIDGVANSAAALPPAVSHAASRAGNAAREAFVEAYQGSSTHA